MTEVSPHPLPAPSPDHPIAFGAAFRVWLRVALLSFGGPAGQIAIMHRILVEEKAWISERRFLHALNFCMLLPGPEAQQLAIYLGWLLHRTPGGIMAGGLFILPGAIALMGLSIIYALWGHIGIVAAAFFGLKAAVLSIVIDAVIRIGRRALNSSAMRAVAAAAFVAIQFFALPFPLVIATAGVIGFAGASAGLAAFRAGAPAGKLGSDAAPQAPEAPQAPFPQALPSGARALRVALVWLTLWLAPVGLVTLGAGPSSVFSQIAVFFAKTALITFGGAYAVLAYVAQAAVATHHWLAPGEMLDGLGLAETTPGPLIMVLQFVGFMAAFRAPGALGPLLAGLLGGLLTTWVTFTPCFLWIFLGAPYVEQLRGNRLLDGALSAITAAVVGVILSLAIWFSVHVLFAETWAVRGFGLAFDAPVLASLDGASLSLGMAGAVMLFGFRLGMIPTLGLCGLGGILLKSLIYQSP